MDYSLFLNILPILFGVAIGKFLLADNSNNNQSQCQNWDQVPLQRKIESLEAKVNALSSADTKNSASPINTTDPKLEERIVNLEQAVIKFNKDLSSVLGILSKMTVTLDKIKNIKTAQAAQSQSESTQEQPESAAVPTETSDPFPRMESSDIDAAIRIA